jgi:hypothetical protein
MATINVSFEGADAPDATVLAMESGEKFILVHISPDVTLHMPGYDAACAKFAVRLALELLVAAAGCRPSKDDEADHEGAALLKAAVIAKEAITPPPPVCDGKHLGVCADPQCWQLVDAGVPEIEF